MKISLKELSQRLGATLHGDSSVEVGAVNAITMAGPGELSFVSDDKHRKLCRESSACAVLTNCILEDVDKPQLVVDNVHKALIATLNMFAPELEALPSGVDETAKIGHKVTIGPGAAIGPDVVIHDGVEIGPGTIIEAGCKIGEDTKIGSNCRIDSNVVIYHHCHIGDNVILQANTTIGSVGFGYVYVDGAHRLVPHNGTVFIEDAVEIGANCCVDRAKFGQTLIGAGTKMDNLVQIGHNCRIGRCCLIAGQVGLAGSVVLDDGVVLGGQVGVGDNVHLQSNVIVGAKGGVMTREVPAGSVLVGTPAEDRRRQFRILGYTRKLPEMFRQLKDLVARVNKLEASENDKK